jgi:iron complex transport system permease protein
MEDIGFAMENERATRRRFWTAIGLSAAAAGLALLVTPLIGPTHVDLARVLAHQSPDFEIMSGLRIPRVLLGMLTGGCLALAGAVFQALLRDALATPYTLGVSSGAALGAVIVICFGLHSSGQLPAIWLGALAGAGLVLVLVLGIAEQGRRMSSFTLLLAGIAINSICSALIQLLHSMTSLSQSFSITRWLMGGVDAVEYSTLAWLTVLVAPAAAIVLMRGRQFNLMAVGEEWAASHGVEVNRLLLTGYIAGSVLTAPLTAVTGPIGFVGLIVPHALRLWLGADHRLLLPCSLLLGAAFLAVCDAIGRVVLAPADIPVGIITAMLGGPFFIWLLRARRKGPRG